MGQRQARTHSIYLNILHHDKAPQYTVWEPKALVQTLRGNQRPILTTFTKILNETDLQSRTCLNKKGHAIILWGKCWEQLVGI